MEAGMYRFNYNNFLINKRNFATSNQGLSEAEAARRLKEHGPNVVAQDKRHTRWRLLGRALINPLVILLSILATVSALTGDLRAAVVMAVMVVLGVVLRFVQEARATPPRPSSRP